MMNWEPILKMASVILMIYVVVVYVIPIYETRNNCTEYCKLVCQVPQDTYTFNFSVLNTSDHS